MGYISGKRILGGTWAKEKEQEKGIYFFEIRAAKNHRHEATDPCVVCACLREGGGVRCFSSFFLRAFAFLARWSGQVAAKADRSQPPAGLSALAKAVAVIGWRARQTDGQGRLCFCIFSFLFAGEWWAKVSGERREQVREVKR